MFSRISCSRTASAPVPVVGSAGQQAKPCRCQVAPGFAGSLGLGGLGLAGFRGDAGLMLRGFPAATGVTAASGSDLKNARQPGLSCDLFLTMQTVTRSTSGMSALQRRNASLVQACSCSGV